MGTGYTHAAGLLPAERNVIDLLAGGGSRWWTLEDIIASLEPLQGRRESAAAIARLLHAGHLTRFAGRTAGIYGLTTLGELVAGDLRRERLEAAHAA